MTVRNENLFREYILLMTRAQVEAGWCSIYSVPELEDRFLQLEAKHDDFDRDYMYMYINKFKDELKGGC